MNINKSTILAVDDQQIILNSINEILRHDYNIFLVNSGEGALAFLNKKHADLILLDYFMDGMSGMETLRQIREKDENKNTPIIFLTGATDVESEIAAFESGAADYIAKPIRPEILTARVRLQIELRNHRRNLENLVAEKTADLNEAYDKLKKRSESTLNLLAKITDMRDEDTGGHIMRVTEYTRVLCDALLDANMDGYWISFDDSEEIVSCSKLHDIGKIAIPDNVLLKPGKLSDEEFEIIKSHTTEGYKFFKEYYMIDDDVSDTYIIIAQEIAYSHHEKWNGRGYPQGLKEEEIPLSGRIVAIADVYDALTSVRPYKKAFTHEKACEIIIGDSGTHFDPYLIELFKESSDKFKRIREKIS